MKLESTLDEDLVKALPPDGVVEYRARWLDASDADTLFRRLHDEVDWEQRSITLFGKCMPQPRLIRFQGDAGVRYTYSGDVHEAQAWHPLVARLRDRLADDGIGRFNSVLVNLYRDGRDSMGWHADDETELGDNPVIASVSLGAGRRFVLRDRNDRGRRLELQPAHGSLIVMRGDLQHHWQHQVPRTRRSVGPRINLTFRTVLPAPARRRR